MNKLFFLIKSVLLVLYFAVLISLIDGKEARPYTGFCSGKGFG